MDLVDETTIELFLTWCFTPFSHSPFCTSFYETKFFNPEGNSEIVFARLHTCAKKDASYYSWDSSFYWYGISDPNVQSSEARDLQT